MPEYTYKRSNYSNGSVRSEVWFEDGKVHRDNDMPAAIYYRKDGSVKSEKWLNDDKCHRDNDKPALIYYHKDGSIRSESWYKDGVPYTPKEDTCDGKTVEIDGKSYKLTLTG